MPEVLASIEAAAGHSFQDRALLKTALTHSSYASEQSEPTICNERLEFLGDAVLELIVSRRLYLHFPTATEGDLTRTRAFLVNEDATSNYALALGLDKALLLGKGENLTGGRKRKSLLGDAFEALLGAVFLDGGVQEATVLVEKVLPNLEETLRELQARDNPKGTLQEYAQGHFHTMPIYAEIPAQSHDHTPHFAVEVRLQGITARGEGSSKKNAEAAAAKAALEQLRQQTGPQDNESPA